MPPGKLQTSILVALGVAVSGCGEKDEDSGDTGVGPCLSQIEDTAGPCLDYPPDSGDSGDTAGPCLDYPVDTGDTGDTGSSTASVTADSRQEATQRVLDRGILPADVAKLLVKRLKGS